jgi:hypothetical protein
MDNADTPNHYDIVIQWFKSETFLQGVVASTLSTGVLSIGALIVAVSLRAVDLLTFAASVLGFLLVACVTWVYVTSHSTLGKQRAKVKKVVSNEQSGVSLRPAWLAILVSTLGLIAIWISQLPLLG